MNLLVLISLFSFRLSFAQVAFPEGQYSGTCQFQVNKLQEKTCKALFNSTLLNGIFHVNEELECSDYRQVSADAFKFKDLTHLDWLVPTNLQKYGEGVCLNGMCDLNWNNGTIRAHKKMSFVGKRLEYSEETAWINIKHIQKLNCKFSAR